MPFGAVVQELGEADRAGERAEFGVTASQRLEAREDVGHLASFSAFGQQVMLDTQITDNQTV